MDDLVVRCKNFEDEPGICGETCGVEVTRDEASTIEWVNVVLDTSPEWFVVLRSCSEHGRHLDPYCSVVCFTSYHEQHEHADDNPVAPIGTDGHRH